VQPEPEEASFDRGFLHLLKGRSGFAVVAAGQALLARV